MLQILIYTGIGLGAGFVAGVIISAYRYPIWEVRKIIRHTKMQGKGMAEWVHEEKFANHHDKVIVKPSCDILYSYTFFDLSQGPYKLKMPPFDRYFSFAFLNINTDVLAYYTNRDIHEGEGVEVLIARTSHQLVTSDLPVIGLDANICWLIGRFGVSSPKEIPSTNQLRLQIELVSLKEQ